MRSTEVADRPFPDGEITSPTSVIAVRSAATRLDMKFKSRGRHLEIPTYGYNFANYDSRIDRLVELASVTRNTMNVVFSWKIA